MVLLLALGSTALSLGVTLGLVDIALLLVVWRQRRRRRMQQAGAALVGRQQIRSAARAEASAQLRHIAAPRRARRAAARGVAQETTRR